MSKAASLEVFKFAFCVFMPIGVLAFVDSPFYQDRYVKPYTLFPSETRRSDEEVDKMLAAYPIGLKTDEERAEWERSMKQRAKIRERAREIYQQKLAEREASKEPQN